MDITLSFGGIAALFTAMAVLATVPSTSVLIVTTRAATQGFMHGAWVSAGVVLGDLFFIVLAIAGLAMLIEWLGPFFVAIKIAGALYLVWLGQALWRRSHGMVSTGAEVAPASVFGSFFSGLALTLGDQKAVLFYLGFLPAFVNLGALTVPDTAIVMAAGAVDVVMVDRDGALAEGDDSLSASHAELAARTNPRRVTGSLEEVLEGADVFIGVSAPGVLKAEWIRDRMADELLRGSQQWIIGQGVMKTLSPAGPRLPHHTGCALVPHQKLIAHDSSRTNACANSGDCEVADPATMANPMLGQRQGIDIVGGSAGQVRQLGDPGGQVSTIPTEEPRCPHLASRIHLRRKGNPYRRDRRVVRRKPHNNISYGLRRCLGRRGVGITHLRCVYPPG